MSTENLILHVDQEHEDENELETTEYEIRTESNNIGSEIKYILEDLREDLDANLAIEMFAANVAKKEFITQSDVNEYNNLAEKINVVSITGITYRQVSLESFETLANTSSTISETVSDVAGKAKLVATKIKEGAIAGVDMAKQLYEAVQRNVTKIAASWNMICKLVESRWLGLKQLADVYEIQHSKLKEKFEEKIKDDEEALAYFKVRLFVAKLKKDGRDISQKDILIDAIASDCNGIAQLGFDFVAFSQTLRDIEILSNRAITLKSSYKNSLQKGINEYNSILKGLVDNTIFKDGGFIKEYSAQSRVLIGGKVVYVGYNNDELKDNPSRKTSKAYIKNISFASVKKRDGGNNETEVVEIESMTVEQARLIFDSVENTNKALRYYHDSNLPKLLKNRQSISNLILFASGLTGGNAAFDTIKRFFNQDDNLKSFNLVAPAALSKLLATFLGASSFAVFSGVVAGAAATYLINELRKYVIANMFTMLDLQYKVTDTMERFDHDYIDTLIDIHNQGYRVCKKLASPRSWN